MEDVRLVEQRPSQELQYELLRPQHDVAPPMAPHHENKDQRMFTSVIVVQDAPGTTKPLSMTS